MALARGEALIRRGVEGATTVTTAHVSDGYFDVLGAHASLGRTFGADEQGPAARHALVLAHRTWIEKFGGDRGIVGRAVDMTEGP